MKFEDIDPKKMPEPVCILKLSWEDIWGTFVDDYNIEPTEEQIIEAFDIAERNADNEAMMGSFWENCRYACSEVYQDQDEE